MAANDALSDDALSPVSRRLAHADLTAPAALVETLSALIAQHGSLYDWAAEQPQPRALRGRAPVYIAALPGTMETVVVRHAWHGGLLAPLTGDRFTRPTRAPLELAMSTRLRAANIPTTVVLGYARYDAWPWHCRVDVVTRFVPDACDLGMVAAGLVPGITCADALAATQRLLGQLAASGVVHPDLNVKNVLLVRAPDAALRAMVIDVDVIRWDAQRSPADTMRVNVARLTRSLRKWRLHFGCDLTEHTLERFTREALAMSAEALSADVRPRPDSHQ